MGNGIGLAFMEQTKHRQLGTSDQGRGHIPPPVELEADMELPRIDLPRPEGVEIGSITLKDAIERRKSVRDYLKAPLSLEELSCLLWCTQGVKEVVQDICTIRTVPSAGARHAFETYLLVNNVTGLSPGLYRFIATRHSLVRLSGEKQPADRVVHACFGQDFVRKGAVTFIWTAVAYRMTWRYGERGYRYIHLDAGHVCQNLYLSALSIGCGACAIAAFDDDEMNSILEIDGKGHFTVYLCTVGKV